MPPELLAFLSGLPILALHLAVAFGLLALGLFFHAALAPGRDLARARAGDAAGAAAFAALAVGLALSLAASLSAARSSLDVVLWGSAALVIYLLVTRLLDVAIAASGGAADAASGAFLTVGARLAAGLLVAAAFVA